jgi:hypothetical protein
MPLIVPVCLQGHEQALPFACLGPTIEAVEYGLPRAIVRWKVAPWDACPAPPQHRFDEFAII